MIDICITKNKKIATIFFIFRQKLYKE